MATNGLVLIQVLMQKIATGDREGMLKYLEALPLGSMKQEKIDALLVRLLTSAQEFNQGSVAKAIITYFENQYTDKYKLPLLNVIAYDQKYEDETVAFILKQFPERSYLELIRNYIINEPNDNMIPGLIRLESIRGPLSFEEYQELYDLSVNEGNYVVQGFLGDQLNTVSPYAPIPDWVKNYTESDDLPYEDELVVPEEDINILQMPHDNEEIIDILTEGLQAAGRGSEEMELSKMELRRELSGASEEDKMAMIREALENKAKRNLSSNEDLFAIFGPVNAIIDDDLTSYKDPYHSFGGCRMFSCIEFEDFLEQSGYQIVYNLSEYKSTDWFKEACQICHLRIRRFAHAIRMPLDHGGWKGCYCSEKCLRRDLNSNVLVTALVDELMKELRRIGIQDRLPVEK